MTAIYCPSLKILCTTCIVIPQVPNLKKKKKIVCVHLAWNECVVDQYIFVDLHVSFIHAVSAFPWWFAAIAAAVMIVLCVMAVVLCVRCCRRER